MTEGVGYKRPPVHSRWKKGQSGNPRGRKAGGLNLKTDLLAELAEVIHINEGGTSKQISKQRALLKAHAARAIKGDAKSANLILNLIVRLLMPEEEQKEPAAVSADDEAILKAYFERMQNSKEDKQ